MQSRLEMVEAKKKALDTVYTPEHVLDRSRFHLMSVIKNELQELVRERYDEANAPPIRTPLHSMSRRQTRKGVHIRAHRHGLLLRPNRPASPSRAQEPARGCLQQ